MAHQHRAPHLRQRHRRNRTRGHSMSKHDIDPLASALEFRPPGDEVLVIAKNAPPRYAEVGEVYETSNDGGDLVVGGVVFDRGGPYASTEVYRVVELRHMTIAGEVRGGSRNRQAREG